jgi:hypothetical protein
VVGEADRHALLHKVKSVAQLRELGAEAVGDSCLLGDDAYEVQPGFLAEAAALQAAAQARPASPPPARARAAPPSPASPVRPGPPAPPLGGTPLPRELEARRKEAEALARFLLENLS